LQGAIEVVEQVKIEEKIVEVLLTLEKGEI
jgi:hypothetical protein